MGKSDIKKFSYSQVNTYKICPKAYEFLYIKKLPSFMTKGAAFWTTIHSTLYKFYEKIKNKKWVQTLFDDDEDNDSLELLISFYNKSWVSSWYKNEDDEFFHKSLWEGMLKRFYNKNKNNWWNPYLLESGFKLHLHDFIVVWRFDRVDKLNWNDVEIVDYKTWNFCIKKYEKNWNKSFDLQLSIYALALKQMWFNPIKAYIYLFNNNVKQEFDIWTDAMTKVEKDLIEIAGGINSWKFDALAAKWKCDACQFNRFCCDRI